MGTNANHRPKKTNPLWTRMLALTTVLLASLALAAGPKDETPELPTAPETTTSLGHPYHGRLKDGIRMPVEGPHHRVQRSTIKRDWVFGTGYLVRGLLVSAASMARLAPDGQPLVLGNLSREGGGDIDMSMSHNTGRDVDIAYYTADRHGQSVESKYHRFDKRGRSRSAPGRYRLDVARNWLVVKSFLSNPEFEAQWVIVAPWIERMLVQHAQKTGEPADFVRQAQRLMIQPAWAKPHDNHIHLRVLCSPEDWRRGCKNAGPVWPFNVRMLHAMDHERKAIVPRLAAQGSDTRLEALQELERKGVDTAVLDVAALLSDVEPRVRKAALDTMITLTTEANAGSVLKTARWAEARAAVPLIAHALPLAGIDGLDTARALDTEQHPVLKGDLPRGARKALLKAARKLLRRHDADLSAAE